MADDHKLNLEENSKYRVAFDLLEKVSKAEGKFPKGDEARKYYIDLYWQCYHVVYNQDTFDEVMEKLNKKSSQGEYVSGGFRY